MHVNEIETEASRRAKINRNLADTHSYLVACLNLARLFGEQVQLTKPFQENN